MHVFHQHSTANNPGPKARVAIVMIWAPWWLNLEFSRGPTGFTGANSARIPARAFAQLTPGVQELVRHRADGQNDAIGDAKWFVAAASQLKPRPHDNDHVQVGPKL